MYFLYIFIWGLMGIIPALVLRFYFKKQYDVKRAILITCISVAPFSIIPILRGTGFIDSAISTGISIGIAFAFLQEKRQ